MGALPNMPHRFMIAGASKYSVAALSLAIVTGVERWWLPPGVMLLMLLAFQMAELLSCYMLVPKAKRHEHDWTRNIFSKFFTWLLWMCAVGMDALVHLAPSVFKGFDLPLLSRNEFLPFTITSTAMFLLAEMARITNNAHRYQGKNSDAWIVMKFLRLLRLVNQQRWQESGREGNAPDRWPDRLTPDQLEHILSYLAGTKPSLPEPVVTAASGHPPAREDVENAAS